MALVGDGSVCAGHRASRCHTLVGTGRWLCCCAASTTEDIGKGPRSAVSSGSWYAPPARRHGSPKGGPVLGMPLVTCLACKCSSQRVRMPILGLPTSTWPSTWPSTWLFKGGSAWKRHTGETGRPSACTANCGSETGRPSACTAVCGSQHATGKRSGGEALRASCTCGTGRARRGEHLHARRGRWRAAHRNGDGFGVGSIASIICDGEGFGASCITPIGDAAAGGGGRVVGIGV